MSKLTTANPAFRVGRNGNRVMRIAVMGTGAVGGYFGAKLAAAGHELIFIARGKQLEALQRDGLQVKSATANLQIRNALFTDDASAAGNVELVLFCVKSYDTEEASIAICPLVGPRTIILSLQNGIDNVHKIAARWGVARVLAGVVYVGAAIERLGLVVHSSGGRIIFGSVEGAISYDAKSVAHCLTTASIPHELSDQIAQVQWSKLLWNASFGAVSSLTRATVKQIVHSESLTNLVRNCMAEVQSAALTRAIDLSPRALDQMIDFSRTLGDFKPSMLQDLEAGKPLEHEAFNGIVVKLLRQAGKTAPTNEAFYAMLDYLDRQIRETRNIREEAISAHHG